MSNIAYIDFDPQSAREERLVADTDNGYTRLANELYEQVNFVDLNRNELKVIHTIIRKTYGFNKKSDRISDSQIVEKTNLSRQAVNFAKNSLLRMHVLLMDGNRIGINKVLSEWDIRECHRKSDSVRKTMTKVVTETMKDLSQFPGHTKDIITKDKKDNIKIVPAIPKNVAKKINKATQQPSEFTPSEKHTALANELGVDLLSEFAVFVDYHASKGSKFKNWDAALNTWLRNAVKFGIKPRSASHRMTENFNEKHYGVSDIPVWME